MKLFVVITLLTFAIASQAKRRVQKIELKESELSLDYEEASPKKKAIIEGFNLGLYYSMADQIDTNHTQANINIESEFEVGGALGLGARYALVRNNNIGFIAGIGYDLPRKFGRVRKTVVTNGLTMKSSGRTNEISFSMFTLEPSATFGVGNMVYILAGPNYVIPLIDGPNSFDINAGFGAQVGLGLAYGLVFAEVQFRTINPSIDYDGLSTTQSRLWGVLFRAGVTF